MFCFGIFLRKSHKRRKLQNLGKKGLLRHSVGNPHRGVDLCQGMGCLAAARPRCRNGTPRVRHGVAVLRRGEGLRRSIAATVHIGQNFGFFF